MPSRSTMAKKPSKHSSSVVSDHKFSRSSSRLVFRTEIFVLFPPQKSERFSYSSLKKIEKFETSLLTRQLATLIL